MTTNEPSPPEMVEVALKACPFCGEAPTYEPSYEEMRGSSCYIGCNQCGLIIDDCYRPANELADAIAAWNTRSTTAESANCEVSEEVVERVIAAFEDDPFSDDLRYQGTFQQHQRFEHYARAAIAAVSGGVASLG